MRSEARPPEVTEEEWTAAGRVADAVNLHVVAQNAQLGNGRDRPGYVALRLSDGRSPDGILYDTRADATRHQRRDPYCFYVKVGRQTMGRREALNQLMWSRRGFKNAGALFTEEEPILPQRLELAQPFIPRTFRGVTRR